MISNITFDTRRSSQKLTHRDWKGFKLFLTWKSRRGKPGRPPVSREIRDLIRRMSREGEGLPRALRVPDEPPLLAGILTALHDFVDGRALVLAQDGFSSLAVLDVEQDPVLERAQEQGPRPTVLS